MESETTAVAAMQRALDWFRIVEGTCSRFDPDSELRRLTGCVGKTTSVSSVLFEAVQFALALAEATGGAFDPTVGHLLENKGFRHNYRTGDLVRTSFVAEPTVSYRDVSIDPARRTITLHRPLVLDLGAIAKGLAIDLAARALSAFENICVEAGGDLSARGWNSRGERWQIGVQDPRQPRCIACVLEIAELAVCTSGDYERRTANGSEHHLIDPRSGDSARELASVTVIAQTAMAADGLGTAAFVLGPELGMHLIEQQGAQCLLITPTGEICRSRGLPMVTQ